ncbi:Gfo/Idh/MocA family protein [Marinomonas mediterranea]|jgi:Predicted dehydrogenases and related proteins|uniref:Oxidoreductase domain protein n=1 Tax=Marinomonas mediterranea (strain ATCC 700492 / JCM 21426 / NBRC 103028 / MMB-1) TaxID=717774 RepID=F2K4B8_MARM1|nr:Gfo/Idh/MocA family oxidoreductase [Marinomonas mediterranea]ADZ92559.1 oxidoreductase domain protein [Marinomonas mediterranea MMB-1]WCN10503.1 Gfo/Idh/MocA family oxidoreductase [Marinomonas mediterranea]WCN14553.1 Gfo/Idh/MocA family oxidoreductase [Marinomonas mediterranea]WCN18603.1 Gfo/Idh/MocA family oxidoreductase [Marinomonas mediterranea MMB-1]
MIIVESYAVIGLGNIAERHRKNLKTLFPSSKIYALSASGRQISETISFCDDVLDSIEEIIALNVKFVIVASPASLHTQHSLLLIQAGIPVLIEKPLSLCSQDALKIKEASDVFNTPVSVGYCLRYLSSSDVVKNYIQEGKIGTLFHVSVDTGQYLPDWRPNKALSETVSTKSELGGGVLFELSHEFDYLMWLLGPLKVKSAILDTSDILALDVEDSVDIILKSDKNVTINVHLDFLQRKAHRYCRFKGSQGTIEWDLINNRVFLLSPYEKELVFSDDTVNSNSMYLSMLLDFIGQIDNSINYRSNFFDAIEVVTVIEKIKSNDF